MNRPEKRNALTSEMVDELATACRALDADPEIEVILLTGAGVAFSAGGDLREKGPSAYSFSQAWSLLAGGHNMVDSIEKISTLVVARVHGYAHAGGLLLSLCADITIASESARFRVPELLRGRPDPFIPPRLVSKVGRERAADLMFTAREVDGREAERIGLVARCVPDEDLDSEIEGILKTVLGTDSDSRSAWKRLLVSMRSTVDPWTMVQSFTTDATARRSHGFTG
jgi:enoyl-CoA hydratase